MSRALETNRLEPQTCAVCRLEVPPSRLAFDRVAPGEFEPRHVDCKPGEQPARAGGSAT